jgi:DNA-directed RNA polymerase subunit alpha
MANSELVFPQKLGTEKQSSSYGKFIAEPFEPGYGHTVGSSLRRILLSSLEGAAITSCRIKGAAHEFDVLKNVKEDVINIILNIKKVRLKMFTKGHEILRLTAKGERTVCAGDIEPNSNIEILNPEQVIATLAHGANLEIELDVNHGRGYVVAEDNKRQDLPVGTIYIDSLFSPVTKVHYEVENTRVGQRTDYDKLIVEISTDDSILPSDALSYAAKILRDSLDVFLVGEKVEKKTVSTIEVIQQEKLSELLAQPIEVLGLSSRPFNSLKNAHLDTIGDLVKKTESELAVVRNLGKKSVGEIKEKLAEHSLNLGMQIG